MTEQNKNEVQEIKWREEFEKDYTSNALAKEVALGVLYYANPNIQAAWNGHLAGRKAARVEIDELTWLCENLSSDLKDRDQEISRLKAESVEVRGYNCDLANENRRLQEQCEILIENADCRGDEDCDHCEAVRVCKPCQLEIEIIEAMKKELGSLEQENERLKKQTAVKRCMACGNIAMTNHGCEIMDQLKERDEIIKECIPYLKCDYSNKALKYDENVKIQKLAEKARKMVGEK